MTDYQTAIEKIAPLHAKWGGHATIQPMEYCAAAEAMVVSHRHCMAPEAWRLSVWTNDISTEIVGIGSTEAPIGEAFEALMLAIPDLKIRYHELVSNTGRMPTTTELDAFPKVINAMIQEDMGHLANETDRIAEDPSLDRGDLDALSQAVSGLESLKTLIEQVIERRAAAQLPTL